MTHEHVRISANLRVRSDHGLFMISVAAELAEMHPQTLRMYEQRGLIKPKRSPKGTRLYSHADVELLRHIQQLTVEMGLNLSGVERVLTMERKLEKVTQRALKSERQVNQLQAQISKLEKDSRPFRGEIIPYFAPGMEIVLAQRRK